MRIMRSFVFISAMKIRDAKLTLILISVNSCLSGY